jgi:TP901 family phage tail tape measure protein
MEIDGKQSISEIGKTEMAAYDLKQEIKGIREEQSKWEKESKDLEKSKDRIDQLTKKVEKLVLAGKENTKEYKRTVDQLKKAETSYEQAASAAKKLNDSQVKVKSLEKSLDGVTNTLRKQREEAGLAGMTMRQLVSHQRDLVRQQSNLTRGTEEYAKATSKLQEVNKYIANQRAEVRGLDSAWQKVRTEITRFGVLALGYLGAQEIIGRIGNLIKGSAELSDALSDVQKTTGLANESVKDLSQTFGQWDTRTPRKDLLAMAEIAGRLGINGKKDIEGFVKAADMIAVSLGDSLGEVETVMRELGKLTSTYNIKEAYGIEESLLKVGSAINELGMASTANESNIVDFTKRMGGIAPLAKISIQDIMGLGATLDSLGQTSEVSSTALSKLFINMAKNATTYAKFARMEVADFVKLMNEDANAAFIKVLEGVKANSGGITELAESLGDLGEDGGRVVGVLGTLVNNIEALKTQQALSNKAFKEGTSIWEEFKTKNENLAASLAKVQKWINGVLINNMFLDFLDKSIGKLADWALGIDVATKSFENQLKYVEKLEANLPDLTDRYDELTSYTVLNTEQQEELRVVIDKIAKLVPTAITEFDKYGNAIAISTEKVDKFTAAQKAALKVKNADAIEEQQKELKKLNSQISQTEQLLNQRDEEGDLFKVVERGARGAQEPVKLLANEIEELQKRLAGLQEKKLGTVTIIGDLLGLDPAMDEEAEAQKQAAAAEAARKAAEEAEKLAEAERKKRAEEQKAAAEEKYKELIQKFKDFQGEIAQLESEAEISAMDKDSQDIARIESKFQTLRDKALEYYTQGTIDKQTYDQTIADIEALQTEQVNAKIDEQSEKLKEKRAKLAEDIEMATMDDHDRQVAATAKRFDELIAQAQEFGLSTIELEKAKLATIEDLNQKHNDRIRDNTAKSNQERLQDEIQVKQALIDINLEYANIAGAAIDLIGNKSGQLTAFQKILALTQIGIDTAAAIMKAEIIALQAASVGGPAAPFIYKATKLSILGSILTAASRAKNILFDSGDPSWGGGAESSAGESAAPQARRGNVSGKRSYYFGGETGDGMGFGDQYGEFAGYVHKHEYVIPQSVRQEPIVQMQIEPILEALRMKKMGRSYFLGGPTDAVPSKSPEIPKGNRDAEIIDLLSKILYQTQLWPREITGKWDYISFKEIEDEYNNLQKRYKA